MIAVMAAAGPFNQGSLTMRVRQDRRAPARYLAVPAWLAASLLSRVRAPSSAPFGGTGSGLARTPRRDRRDLEVPALRRGRAGPGHRPTACRDCAQWRVSARLVCGSARRFGPVPAMTETAFGDLPLYRCGRSMLVRAPLVLRLRVFLVRWSLDRRIAAGCSCDSSVMLNLRARQLIRRRTRRGLARSLRDVVAYVDRDGSRRAFSTVVIRRGAVRADREAILGLAERQQRLR